MPCDLFWCCKHKAVVLLTPNNRGSSVIESNFWTSKGARLCKQGIQCPFPNKRGWWLGCWDILLCTKAQLFWALLSRMALLGDLGGGAEFIASSFSLLEGSITSSAFAGGFLIFYAMKSTLNPNASAWVPKASSRPQLPPGETRQLTTSDFCLFPRVFVVGPLKHGISSCAQHLVA